MSTEATAGPRALRHPTPDVARGVMLALIAVANVPTWLTGPVAQATMTDLDRAWQAFATLFVDGRAYPLFGMLFGFGLATIVQRIGDRPDAGAGPGGVSGAVRARRLLRRRGWWLVAFGAVHALLFAGDILGTYGLIALALAGLVAGRKDRLLVAVAVVVGVLALASLVAVGAAVGEGSTEPGLPELGTADVELPSNPLMSLGMWAAATLAAPFTSMMTPSVVLGVFLARTSVLRSPEQHTRALAIVAAGGLLVAALGALPQVLTALGTTGTTVLGGFALHSLAGVAGGAGWLALIALIVGRGAVGPQGEACPAGSVRSLLTATGTRSMTAYLAQTLVFAAVFPALGASGIAVGAALAAVIALVTWLLIALACLALERAGRPGPCEALMRRLVHGPAGRAGVVAGRP